MEQQQQQQQNLEKRRSSKRRRKSKQCVVKRAKLILPDSYGGQSSDGQSTDGQSTVRNDGNNEENDDFSDDGKFEESTSNINCRSEIGDSTVKSSGQTSGDDSGQSPGQTPPRSASDSDLVTYFEEVLFAAKPMSLMAELMYG